MKKRFLSMLLVLVMIIMMLPNMPASAMTSQQGAEWALAQIGRWIDTDGQWGAQCVDLIVEYCRTNFGWNPQGSGDAAAYRYVKLPNSSWQRIQNTPDFIPQPGDIAIWNPAESNGYYGHVAIVVSANINTLTTVDQNLAGSNNGSAAAKKTRNYSNFWGVIRPPFSSTTTECQHSYVQGLEKSHLHREYMKCTSCGEYYYTGKYGYEIGYEKSHPHREYYICKVTNCEYNNTYTGDNHYLESCSLCNVPEKPALLNLAGSYIVDETIEFKWETTANTTHYNFYVYRKDDNGEWKQCDRIDYAVSGIVRTYAEGEYRALLESKNSKFWNSDGTDWLATCSDYYYFEVKNPMPDISVDGVSIDKATLLLEVGDSVELIATVSPSDASDQSVVWESSDESIAIVENGVVTAVGAGNTLITVATNNGGHTAVCNVIVNEKRPEEPQMMLGDLNGDLKINSADAGLILRYDAGIISLSQEQLAVADINRDGKVDSADAGLILRYDAGIIETFN